MSNGEQELAKYGIFSGKLPKIVETIADSISNTNIPYRMKVAIAMAEVVKYTSQFKRHIMLDDSLIPINAITFCIGKSGVGKDSSVRAVQKCFNDSYTIINDMRIEHAKQLAIQEATSAGRDNPSEWASYKDFYIAPGPLEVGVSTAEGLLQHFAEISQGPIGSGYLYSGELGAELQTNTNMVDNIKVISEMYDTGDKSMKALKDKTKQTEVGNVAVSALFMGSQDNILYDDSIKKKFKIEFTTKLGRRSFFVFVNEDIKAPTNDDIILSIQKDREAKKYSVTKRKEASEYINDLTEHLLPTIGLPITMSEETEVLFFLYKRYTEDLGEKISVQFPITRLARAHYQWKALKVAGALALLDGKQMIEVEHYVDAIRFTEMLAIDTLNFERELVKEAYEVFCSYCKDIAVDNKAVISLHSLRKLGHIPMKGNPTAKMTELIQLANSYDKEANYKLEEDTIVCNILVKTDIIHISYLDCTGTKEERKPKCSSGYYTEELTFDKLQYVLQEDLAYSPFIFKNGIRGKDNIISGCKWIVLDIDQSNITDEEAHLLLSDLNHYVVRSSDPNNEFKFRVVLELDAEIDVPDSQWGLFIKTVGEELGLTVDKLGKSQVFFSYSDSKNSIQYTLDGDPLEVKPILDKVEQLVLSGPTDPKQLPTHKKKESLDNPTVTFRYAYEAKNGEGSRCLMRAAYHARDLGATAEEIIEILTNINNYWNYPLDEERMERTLFGQIRRW